MNEYVCVYIEKKSDKQSARYSEEKKKEAECFDGIYVKVIKHENGKKTRV